MAAFPRTALTTVLLCTFILAIWTTFSSTSHPSLGKPWWSKQKSEAVVQEIQSIEHLDQILSNVTFPFMVIEVYGNNCPYCVQVAPKYENLAKELSDRATFLKANIDRIPSFAQVVQAVPTFMFFCAGKAIAHLPSADERQLYEATAKLLVQCTEFVKQAKSEPKVQLHELCPASIEYKEDMQIYGTAIDRAYPVENSTECCGVCTVLEECQGFTFVVNDEGKEGKGSCFLKTEIRGFTKTDPKLKVSSGLITRAMREEVERKLNDQLKKVKDEERRAQTGMPASDNDIKPAKCKFMGNVDFSGHDMPDGTIKRESQQDCCNYCAAVPKCEGFTFMEEFGKGYGWCFLKASTRGRRDADPRMHITSGIVTKKSK